ncbi:uncharacterized protein V6R79_008783 [Siganus canaliculatus]
MIRELAHFSHVTLLQTLLFPPDSLKIPHGALTVLQEENADAEDTLQGVRSKKQELKAKRVRGKMMKVKKRESPCAALACGSVTQC